MSRIFKETGQYLCLVLSLSRCFTLSSWVSLRMCSLGGWNKVVVCIFTTEWETGPHQRTGFRTEILWRGGSTRGIFIARPFPLQFLEKLLRISRETSDDSTKCWKITATSFKIVHQNMKLSNFYRNICENKNYDNFEQWKYQIIFPAATEDNSTTSTLENRESL